MEVRIVNKEKNPVKFTVSRKPDYREDKSMNISLRINKQLVKQYDEWALKTNYSRNQFMCMALDYAIKNIEFIDGQKENNTNI